MKRVVLIIGFLVAITPGMWGQQSDDRSAIKLFVSSYDINRNDSDLPQNLQNRLLSKITQLINQTGVAEVGYSNFYVTPKMDVLSKSVDQTGVSKVYLAECELLITISRRDFNDVGGAVYNSFSKKIMGSGSSEAEAIANAVNNISSNDKKVIDFLTASRVKIDEYFKAHCDDVLKEAEQSYELKLYSQSIALYFSIPSNSKCYEDARDKSIKVFVKYNEEKCNAALIKLRSYIAMGQSSENSLTKNYYDSALSILSQMRGSTDVCIGQAQKEIEKIEKKLDASQKRAWEAETKSAANTQELRKEWFRAMAKISQTYQPPSSGDKVIIVK